MFGSQSLLHLGQDGSLQTTEAEVQIVALQLGPGQGEAGRVGARRIRLGCQRRQRRTARVAQFQQLRALVEGFARGIVDRLAQQGVGSQAVHAQQLRVATGDQQRHEGKLGRVV